MYNRIPDSRKPTIFPLKKSTQLIGQKQEILTIVTKESSKRSERDSFITGIFEMKMVIITHFCTYFGLFSIISYESTLQKEKTTTKLRQRVLHLHFQQSIATLNVIAKNQFRKQQYRKSTYQYKNKENKGTKRIMKNTQELNILFLYSFNYSVEIKRNGSK